MKISKLALIALLGGALAAIGCSSDSSNGGGAGAGGEGGAGGMAIDPGPACVDAALSCTDAAIDPIEEDETCSLEPPPENISACPASPSLENPTECASTGEIVTITLTQLIVPSDAEGNSMCNQGYNLDGCDGNSCRNGGLAPGEGMNGVDNALAGLAPVLIGVNGNLGGVNQAFYDGLCSGDIAIGFQLEVNNEDNCAILTVIDDGEPSDTTVNMNYGNGGCLSGTIGRIPLNVAGIPGSMNNAVIVGDVSGQGLSNGILGATVDKDTASSIADQLLDGGAAVVAQVLDINDDLSGASNIPCDALSISLLVGGPGETSGGGGSGGAGGAGGAGQ